MEVKTQDIKKWILDTSTPFKGYTQSWMQQDGTVAYSDGLSFKEYNAKNGGNMKLISERELDALLDEHYKGLQKPWTEITEEYYWDMYECLPPIYKSPFWFICEATTGSLHSCYIEHKGKYYTALRDRFTRTEELWANFKEDILDKN